MILFTAGVDDGQLSEYARGVLIDLLRVSGNPDALVDSMGRTPAQQAHAMFVNLEAHGVANQRALYKAPGNHVIDVYEQSKRDGHGAGDILQDMTDAIIHIGPELVSAHCRDPRVTQVMDVLRSKLKAPLAFVQAAKANPRVSKVLDEAYNGCIHVEVPQLASMVA